MRRSLLPFILGGVAFATVFAGLGQRDAHAARYYYAARGEPYGRRGGDNGVTLDVDGDLLIPVANSYLINNGGKNTTVNPFNTGFGLDARLGFRAGGRGVFVQPELEGGFDQFQWVNKYGFVTSADTLGRFMAGARLGASGVFEPQAYAHLGGAVGGYGVSGFTYDLGGALNIRLRRITFGAHAGFNQIVGSNINGGACANPRQGCVATEALSIKWVDLGVNAGVVF
jgi:hypothetical protein